MIPVDLPMNMNSLPLAPAQQWQHLRWTIEILKLTRPDIPSGSTVFDELVSYAPRMLDSWESINVPAYERWYDYYISKRGEGGLNEAEQEYISFIVKIANWNVSIHNLPELIARGFP
jgi:hypothetical protein